METSKGGRKRRKWPWTLLALLLFALAFAPQIASPFVQGRVQTALQDELGGSASFRSFALGWPGKVQANGLHLVDDSGETVVLLGSIRASASLWKALFGSYDVDVDLSGVEVHLEQTEDGSWKLGDMPASEPEDGEQREGEGRGERDEEEKEPLDLSARLALASGRIFLHGKEGELALKELQASARVSTGGTEASRFELSFVAEGQDGPAGRFRTEGELLLGESLDPARVRGEASLILEELTLAAFQPLFAALTPERIPRGRIDGELGFQGGLERSTLTGHTTITDFEVEVPTSEGKPPLVLQDPKATLTLDVELAPEKMDLAIEEIAIDSIFARGKVSGRIRNLAAWLQEEAQEEATFEDLKGELTYQPQRLGALLEPWLPFELSGDEEERISFQVDGSAPAPDIESLLAGLQTTANIGLGRIETTGLVGSGTLQLQARDGAASWSGEFLANGGALSLDGGIEFSSVAEADGVTTLNVGAEQVEANSQLAPLLSVVHPAFATVESLQGSEIGGLIDCSLDLSYAGPLKGEPVASGWEGFPKTALTGSGRFAITGARIQGTPALVKMLDLLGVDATKEYRIRPIEFEIRDGRLHYSNEWTWTIDGIETNFTGSVGLDHTLDMSWNVPVTDELIEKNDFLSFLKGQKVRLPITGTVKRPRLDWRDAVKDLTSKDLKDELFEQLGVKEDEEGGDDPGSLLREADRLWDEGKKSEAAVIYKRIREDFKVSLVYVLNRDKIKKRAKYKE